VGGIKLHRFAEMLPHCGTVTGDQRQLQQLVRKPISTIGNRQHDD
jgi:hypothetical protein